MPTIKKLRKPRLQIVDAIRGFALFGILMIHSIEHFELYKWPESSGAFLAWSNDAIFKAIFFIFAGKAYSMFSIMFGFSFYIQMNNQAERGVDFRLRFVWRLIVLFVFGYLLALMYMGDVLTVFAVLGLPLVLLHKWNNKMLIWLCIILLIQVPTLYHIYLSVTNPEFVFQQDWSIFGKAVETFAEGSFREVLKFNSYSGHVAKWTFTYNTGRYLQMIALFIIGILLGRTRFFEDIEKKSKRVVKIFAGSILGFLLTYPVKFILPLFKLNETQSGLFESLASSWSDLFFTAFLMSGFVLIYLLVKNKSKYNLLAAYGRMSLTNYVLQPLVGVLIFYGYGLGMYKYFNVTYSLLYGILFFILQLLFCKYWFKMFYYGPLEWLWRAITFFDFGIKMKKISIN
jgi:uncharacterized protein